MKGFLDLSDIYCKVMAPGLKMKTENIYLPTIQQQAAMTTLVLHRLNSTIIVPMMSIKSGFYVLIIEHRNHCVL